MKKYLQSVIIVSATIAISGCTVVQPSFDASNQKILEDSMNAIEIGKVLKSKLPSGANIALRSMEHKKTLDRPVDNMIQDNAIASLVNNGFRVLERDEDAVANLLLEDNKKLKVEKKQHTIVDALEVKKLHLNSMTDLTIPAESFTRSKFKAATYLLSYRVLEAGITYHSLDDGFQWSDLGEARWWFPWAYPMEVDRESMVRLHLRAVKAKTGEIVYAGDVMALNNEIIDQAVAKKLKDYHYDFFSNDLVAKAGDADLKDDTVAKQVPSSLDFLKQFTSKLSQAPKQNDGINVDALIGLNSFFGIQVTKGFDFGTLTADYHTHTVTTTSYNTYDTASSPTQENVLALFYTLPLNIIDLKVGYASSGFAYGISVVLLKSFNLKAHYLVYGSLENSGPMLSAGFSF